ncbi:hypothetical protein GCM10007928_19580 [Sulfitobacter porphyrae]|nr:hypothetical protein GCM10007928_19580 [Sulfitobacter porphyrae]
MASSFHLSSLPVGLGRLIAATLRKRRSRVNRKNGKDLPVHIDTCSQGKKGRTRRRGQSDREDARDQKDNDQGKKTMAQGS